MCSKIHVSSLRKYLLANFTVDRETLCWRMHFLPNLHSALKRWQSKVQHNGNTLPWRMLTGARSIRSSSSKTGMCRALLWLDWSHRSWGAGTLRTPSPVGIPHVYPSTSWGKRRLGKGCCNRAITAAHVQPPLPEHSSSAGYGWMNSFGRERCSSYPPSGWQGGPHEGWFLWSAILTIMFSPWMLICGRGTASRALACLLLLLQEREHCYARFPTSRFDIKVQSRKIANSRLQNDS